MGNIVSVDSSSFDQLVQPFLPFLCGKWKYLYNLEDNLEALQKDMQDLNAMRNDLSKRVLKEEERGLQGSQEVKGWISMVEEIEPQANHLLDESISEIRRLSMYGYCSRISESTYRYNEKVLMTLKKVETLRSKGGFEVVVDGSLRPRVIKMPPIQLTVSQAKLLDTTWARLMDKNVGTLGIYGRGGVGKTTLLTQIKNKFLEAKDAGLVIFVVVGFKEVESIQEEISKILGLQWVRETKKQKAAEILTALKGKRFLLLLDDIQKGLDLEEIGVPLPSRENGCKIVLTTRSREACDESKWVDAMVEITCLSPEEAWDLFQDIVGENTLRSHQDIPKLARLVASACRGLPLALNLIGEAMSRKRTVREWRYTIHVLASSTAEFPNMEDGALPILKSIYDNMSGENIRICFLYCALFPENCDIRKEDLVNYWICEGILAKDDREKAEIQGYEIICDLVRKRLLMEGGNGYCVKMHGVVREMALWIASDFGRQKETFVVLVGGERKREMPAVNDWTMVRRMSVTSTPIEYVLVNPQPQCSELTTLCIQGNSNLGWISGDFFRWMANLVVLDLSYNRNLGELSEEVSCLVSLRFLNLSYTFIASLPTGLKELKSLIHLDLDYTSRLYEIDVIASLLNLQVLRLFRSVPKYISLKQLQLLINLKELSLTVDNSAVLERLLSIHRLASCIRRLCLKEVTITKGGVSLLNDMFSFRELYVERCKIPDITVDMRSNMIQRMTTNFGNIEEITHLWNIRRVSLHKCEVLRDLTWLLFVPNLGDLQIYDCQQIERIISRGKATAQLGDTSEEPFRKLTRLSLIGLPELKSIHWNPLPFPDLEFMEIRRCPKLRRLPFNSESAKGKNVQIELDNSCGKEVFQKLDVVESLLSAGDFKVVDEPAPPPVVVKELLQQTIGPTFEKIWENLRKDEIRMVGIYGMGGVGKTTLLTQINNKFDEVKDEFDVVIWVEVSQDPDIGKIQDDIGKIQDDIGKIQDNIGKIQDEIGKIQDDIRKIQDDIGKIQDDIGKIPDDIGKIQDDIGKIQDDIGKIPDDIGKIQNDIGKIPDDIGNIQDDIRKIQDDIRKIQDDIGKIPNDIGNIQYDIWKIQDDIGKIPDDIGKIPDDIGKIQDDIGKIPDDIRKIQDDIRKIPDDIGKIQDDIRKIPDDIGKILDDIGKRLGLYDDNWCKKLQREKAGDIHWVLEDRTPRFVLLLDGLWRAVSFTDIGIPLVGAAYKVVFTTRSRVVCGRMGADKDIEVQYMPENVAWDFFKLKARLDKVDGEILHIAKKIAAKCCGSPLVIEVIGKTMASKNAVDQWKGALDTLESYASEFKGAEDPIFYVLKLGYDNLEKKDAKCFQYCALFPKEYNIKKDELVEYWIGEGFIDENDGRETAKDRGYNTINTLLGVGLLVEDDESEQKVYMHAMIREMALWIVSTYEHGERFVVKTDARLRQLPDVTDWTTVTKMSLMNNKIKGITNSRQFPNPERLVTLFLQNMELGDIVGRFFQVMSTLVVLDLSRNPSLTELPEEISMLVALRYLSLLGTGIKELPGGLGKLIKLIHLDLESTPNLGSISLISGLLKLQVLKFYDSGAALDLSLLEELKRLKHLGCLTINVRETGVLIAFLGSKLAGCTQGLYLQGLRVSGVSFVAIFGALGSLCNLKMISCDIIESDTYWEAKRRHQDFPSTSSNQITQSSPWFKNLLTVELFSCTGLRDLTWLIYAENLESLTIIFSYNLEELISETKAAGVGVEPFQKLKVLHLHDLDKLKRIYWSPLSFPRLKRLVIKNCRNLRKLPLNSTSVAIIYDLHMEVEKEWLEGVEWENGAKERFLPVIRTA